MQYCRIISLDNNNSVKFTSSREDNSTTNDSMVMKIAHAQLHMYTNIMYQFQSSTCKTIGEKLRTKLCPRMDGHGDSSISPSTSLWGVYISFIEENSVGNGENAGNQHFLPFPHCLQKPSSLGSLKVGIVWYKS